MKLRFLKTFCALATALLIDSVPSIVTAADADSAYVFTSFRDADQKFLRYLYSFDGYHWTNVPGTFLAANVGTNQQFRDPSIVRGPDGTFHLVWTAGWHGDQGFGYANSKDLVHWSAQKFVPVMTNEPTTVNVWAPEIFYFPGSSRGDEAQLKNDKLEPPHVGCYVIIWASTIPGRFPDLQEKHDNNHRLYFTTTRDFKEFAPAKLFFEPGFSVIDGFILQDGNKFVLLNKDNSRPNLNLRVAFADSPLGAWTNESEPFTQKFTEGPAALKVGDDWLVYFDAYREKIYGALKTRDFKTFTNVTKEVSFPAEHKHGTALRVPREILDGLLKNAEQQVLAESNYSQTISGRADDILKILALIDTNTAAKVHAAIVTQYRSLRSWHDENDSRLKAAKANTNATTQIRASLEMLHEKFLSTLAEKLSPEQTEAVKDKLTYGKVQFTFAGYMAAYPGLAEVHKQKILELLKQAREEAMDGGSAEEKTAVFQKAKGKINNYLSKQGIKSEKKKTTVEVGSDSPAK